MLDSDFFRVGNWIVRISGSAPNVFSLTRRSHIPRRHSFLLWWNIQLIENLIQKIIVVKSGDYTIIRRNTLSLQTRGTCRIIQFRKIRFKGNPNMREKIVLLGAGSAVFTRGLLADLIQRQWEVDVALVDIDDQALAVAEGVARKMIESRGAQINLSVSLDRRDVLKDATVVISTIGVGGRRAWEQDVFIPREYGIYQPVGDTVMPGGTSRALRMVPVMVAVAEDVADLAPQSLFFNYANPMSPICRAVRKTTGCPVIGLCHGVFHVEKFLACHLGVSPQDLDSTAVGINHLTWFTEIGINGVDAMGQLKDIAHEQLARVKMDNGREEQFAIPEDYSNDSHEGPNPFSWELFQLFGAFPAVLDRHVTEYFPQFFADGRYYGRKLGIDAYSFEDCIAQGDATFREMEEIAFSSEPLPETFFDSLSGEHEQVVEIVESIRKNALLVYSTNLPNRGQIPNLPQDVIVESPALACRSGIKPLVQKPLSESLVGTLAMRFQWVETVVQAALEGCREKFTQALVLDGAVDSMESAVSLADDLLQAHAEYLPQFNASNQ
jgi:alpha-galactosidase